MYRNILVPVDGTPLSRDTAAQAVELASEVKARVTFLYATPDFSATSDGALLIAMAPERFVERAKGDSDAVLSEVSAIAKASGIEFDTMSEMTDMPYRAIITTAKEKKCDLIFMSSHGKRGISGLLHDSQTQQVLRHSPIPVCVAKVESNLKKAA